jgi:aspartate aminotransferase
MSSLAAHLPADARAAAARALNATSRGMQGSMILGIAGEVRAMIAGGAPVCNLTVGDFDPKQFPIPRSLRDAVVAAYDGGQTNYPPAEGIPELRKAVAEDFARRFGVEIAPEWVIIASGARPVMYGTYRLFLEPGDELCFCVPSWNNGYYGQLTGARMVPIATSPATNFFPTVDQLRPPLRTARLFTLNSPLNPTGTVIDPARLGEIAQLVLDENARRDQAGERPLLWMFDQVYGELVFGTARHAHPCALVPEVAPYVVTIDAVSKCFAATGVRVGWAIMPPYLAERMKAFLGHVGAWAPRPEQYACTALLGDIDGRAAFGREFRAALEERLELLHRRLDALGVEHLVPQGALYLSVRFDPRGRTNEEVRKWLLARAGLAVVPFQAFDLLEDTGWFRMSVGAASPAQIGAAMDRLEEALRSGD